MKHSISLDQLKQEYIWCLWGYRYKEDEKGNLTGEITKKPIQVPLFNPKEFGARVDKPNDWKPYEKAAEKYTENAAKNIDDFTKRYEGVGFRFANLGDYSLCGLDIDAHKEGASHTGNVHLAALQQLFAGTYMEYSPSGNGVHIVMLMQTDKIPAKKVYTETYYQKNDNDELEFYPSEITNRFFTFTGNQIGECNDITDMTEEALAFLEKYMRKPQKAAAPAQRSCASRILDEAEIERRIKRACVLRSGFADLFKKGATGKYGNDDSRADQALCGHLSYYFDCNAEVMDEVFRRSALYRPKWDERHGGKTYGEMTIETAIQTHTGHVYSDALDRVPVIVNGKKERLTIEYLADELTNNWGITVRENEITRNMDFITPFPRRINYEDLVTELYSSLGEIYTGCNFQTIDSYIAFIGRRNSYNPVLEYLHTLEWDGQDYLSQLYDLMGIDNADWLSRALIRKWLLQSYAVLSNTLTEPFAADGVLTLSGKQGYGKSAIFSHLALRAEWFGDGRSLDKFNKDTEQWILETWISEFGEVESSFTKASAEDMKQFISRKVDTYRPPYAKKPIVAPRQTSLCATCNNERYLVDKTGNRRWYTVPIKEKIPYMAIKKFPFTQLWAQIVHIFNTTPNDDGYLWHLTPEEEEALEQRNTECGQLVKGEAEIVSILDHAETHPNDHKIMLITASDWKNAWSTTRYRNSLQRYSAEQIGRALNALKYESTRSRVNGTRARYYELPVPITYND